MIPHSINTLQFLRQNKKRIFFLSNASSINREKCTERLNKRGIDAHISEVYCASYLSAQFFKIFLPNISKVRK